ncbi:MAG: hypothetical protein ACTSV1_09225 [Alphaproteobacteria bacterium]
MHRKIIEGGLRQLSTERAAYFGDLAGALESDARCEGNANMVFTVVRDIMVDLPIYLEKDELLDLLFGFIDSHHDDLRDIMFSPGFIRDASCLRRVTGLFVHLVVTRTLEKQETIATDDNDLSVHKLTWPYRDTDVIDPDEEPDAWDVAVEKAANWDGDDRRASGAARIDDMAAEKARKKEDKD